MAKIWKEINVSFQDLSIDNIPSKDLFGKKYSKMDWEWSWEKVCQIVEIYRPRLKSLMVTWEIPETDTWKLNTDGSFMANKGKGGASVIVRKRNDTRS